VLPEMPNHKLKRQKKMGETPIILLPVVAPEPHMKSRTPSDFAIVAIFQDKRKPPGRARRAFPLDFTAIFCRDGGAKGLMQGIRRDSQGSIASGWRSHPALFFARTLRTLRFYVRATYERPH
jgi:hypothetical protein